MIRDRESEIQEARAAQIVRNALLIAGSEMGEEGDHWPVINATVRSIAQDCENAKTERAVYHELKKFHKQTIEDIKAMRGECPEGLKADFDAMVKELEEIHEAGFTDPAPQQFSAEIIPIHIKRAKAIIDTLGGKDEC